MDLSFALVNEAAYPEPAAVIAAAAECGIELTLSSDDPEGPMAFDMSGDGSLMVMLIPAPHPDVPHMPIGPLSPPEEQLAAAPAHYIITALGLTGTTAERDMQMASLTAAVIRGSKAAGAMLAHGILFHKPELFAELAKAAAEEGVLPIEICVDITAARESEERMSYLTHGLVRYGREEFFVTAPIDGRGALGFVLTMVRWMIADPSKQLPTGDTVGRTAEERLRVQRVPSPTGEGPDVIRLDLP